MFVGAVTSTGSSQGVDNFSLQRSDGGRRTTIEGILANVIDNAVHEIDVIQKENIRKSAETRAADQAEQAKLAAIKQADERAAAEKTQAAASSIQDKNQIAPEPTPVATTKTAAPQQIQVVANPQPQAVATPAPTTSSAGQGANLNLLV